MTIEVLPGWELVRIGKPVVNVDWVIGSGGLPELFSWATDSHNWPIIRKIEKPKQYRPFENAAEAEPFFDRRLRYKADDSAIMRITVLGRNGIEIAKDRHTYKEAFDRFVLTDGTPFGIEVTE